MSVQKCIKYNLLDITGNKKNLTQELNLRISETTGNYLVHKDLLRHFNSQRQGTLSTKTKSEVRGGGRKPWQQKGTGRARAGSNTSPLWRGGGVIFGPKPKSKSLKLNKKERKLALQTLLYNKKNNILILDNLEDQLTQSKTKEFLKICSDCKFNLNKKLLVIVSEKTVPLKLSIKNLKNVELLTAKNLNSLSLLKANQIICTSLAIRDIKEIYCE